MAGVNRRFHQQIQGIQEAAASPKASGLETKVSALGKTLSMDRSEIVHQLAGSSEMRREVLHTVHCLKESRSESVVKTNSLLEDMLGEAYRLRVPDLGITESCCATVPEFLLELAKLADLTEGKAWTDRVLSAEVGDPVGRVIGRFLRENLSYIKPGRSDAAVPDLQRIFAAVERAQDKPHSVAVLIVALLALHAGDICGTKS